MELKGTILRQENSGEKCEVILTIRCEPPVPPPKRPKSSRRDAIERYERQMAEYRAAWYEATRLNGAKGSRLVTDECRDVRLVFGPSAAAEHDPAAGE